MNGVVLRSSLADLGTQVQKLLADKLERDLGRPLERSGGRLAKSAAGETAIVPGGNVVPQEPEQVRTTVLYVFFFLENDAFCFMLLKA